MFAFVRRHPAAAVFTAALVVRLVVAFAIHHYVESRDRDFLIEGDANGYWELAGDIVAGEDYAIANRRASRMPGFPLLLAGVRWVSGDSVLAARFVICAIGAFGSSIVFWLGQSLVSDRVGWLAGLWTAFSPTLAGFTPLILTESVFATCLVGSILLLHFLNQRLQSDRPTAWLALATGLAVGLATYMRPTWLLAAPAFAALLLWEHRNARGLLAATVLIFAGVGSLVPWAVRNQQATGHFVLTTLWVGPSLYDGLHPGATGASDMQFVEDDDYIVKMGEFESNLYYRDEAIAFAKSNPRRSLVLATIKLARFWSPLPNAEQFKSLVPRAACLIGFVPLMLLAAKGGWVGRKQIWLLILTLSPIGYFSLLHMVFVGSLRYRLPAEYPLSVLAAVGLLGVKSR